MKVMHGHYSTPPRPPRPPPPQQRAVAPHTYPPSTHHIIINCIIAAQVGFGRSSASTTPRNTESRKTTRESNGSSSLAPPRRTTTRGAIAAAVGNPKRKKAQKKPQRCHADQQTATKPVDHALAIQRAPLIQVVSRRSPCLGGSCKNVSFLADSDSHSKSHASQLLHGCEEALVEWDASPDEATTAARGSHGRHSLWVCW